MSAAGCGIERRAVKTGTVGDAHLVNTGYVVSANIVHLRSLTPPAALPTTSPIRPVETTVWMDSAAVLRVKIVADHDYFLGLADAGGP